MNRVDGGAIPPAPLRAHPSRADLCLVRLAYLWRHRRLPDLERPRLFTEFVQWRKLHDRDPRLPRLIDKVAIKTFVADRIGRDWITPTLWHGTTLPPRPRWPVPFVVKSRHGCNQRRFIFDAGADWGAVRRAGARWTSRAYGGWLAEWGYRDVPRGILVEPFVGTAAKMPIDYKLYVFRGQVAAIQVHLDRETNHRWILLDPDWNVLSRGREVPPRPRHLAAIIAAAQRLGAPFDFVRIDFYDTTSHPRFGEMTFYPGSGLDPFGGDGIDAWLGAQWRNKAAGGGGVAAAP